MTDTTRDSGLDTTSVVPVTIDPTGGPESTLSAPAKGERARSLGSDAWEELRHRPMFWISAALIVFFVLMAAFPQLFTSTDPHFADLSKAREAPSATPGFGRDSQGYDVYARTVYGPEPPFWSAFSPHCSPWSSDPWSASSPATAAAGLIRSQPDQEIFLGIPLLLGGILFIYTFRPPRRTARRLRHESPRAWHPGLAFDRPLMRSSVLQVKPNDYVQAARPRCDSVSDHQIPHPANSLASVIVISRSISRPTSRWRPPLVPGYRPPAARDLLGHSDLEASSIGLIRAAPYMLLFPSAFLSATVLAFIMLGDCVRDALDPKLR